MSTHDECTPVKLIRLKTGDDIVSEVVEIGEDDVLNYLLINPLQVLYTTMPQEGYTKVLFTPWVFPSMCDKQEFMIKSDDVLMIVEVSEKMEKYYWETMDIPEEKEPEIRRRTVPDDDGLERLKEVLEQLGIDGKRTLH